MTQSYGIGRGNHTRGPLRRGQRGRPPLAEPAATTTVKLSERHLALARYLGQGTTSEGLRTALDALQPFLRNPPEIWALLASASKHCSLTGQEGQRTTLYKDLQQLLSFLERAGEDCPAGQERRGEVPRCYDHPEHDPECAACQEAAGSTESAPRAADAAQATLVKQGLVAPHTPLPAALEPGQDVFTGVEPKGRTVTVETNDDTGEPK